MTKIKYNCLICNKELLTEVKHCSKCANIESKLIDCLYCYNKVRTNDNYCMRCGTNQLSGKRDFFTVSDTTSTKSWYKAFFIGSLNLGKFFWNLATDNGVVGESTKRPGIALFITSLTESSTFSSSDSNSTAFSKIKVVQGKGNPQIKQ